MIKPITLDGITYTKPFVEASCEAMIASRDEAFITADFTTAVFLSHIIAMLGHYAENLEAA